MRYNSIAFRCLRYFANNPGLPRAVTIIQLAERIDVKAGMHVYQRLRCDLLPKWPGLRQTDDNTWWMTARDARKALRQVRRIARAHFHPECARRAKKAAA